MGENPYKSPVSFDGNSPARFLDRMATELKKPLTPTRSALVCLPFSAVGVIAFRMMRAPPESLNAFDIVWAIVALWFPLICAFCALFAHPTLSQCVPRWLRFYAIFGIMAIAVSFILVPMSITISIVLLIAGMGVMSTAGVGAMLVQFYSGNPHE